MKIDWDKVWHGYAIWAGIQKPENLLPPLPLIEPQEVI